jgi:hypothetical protein
MTCPVTVTWKSNSYNSKSKMVSSRAELVTSAFFFFRLRGCFDGASGAGTRDPFSRKFLYKIHVRLSKYSRSSSFAFMHVRQKRFSVTITPRSYGRDVASTGFTLRSSHIILTQRQENKKCLTCCKNLFIEQKKHIRLVVAAYPSFHI